jgi:regulatory protein
LAGRSRSFTERRESRAAVDDPQVVLEAAARFLEARSRSVAEVRRRLTSAGYQVALVEGAISKLLEFGVLDDDVFARAWVESRDRAHPRGERAIREELQLKGIDRSTVDLVLADRREAVAEVDPGEAFRSPDRIGAERLIAKHGRALARIADPRLRRQKAYAILARHAFDPETCREVAAMAAASAETDIDTDVADD